MNQVEAMQVFVRVAELASFTRAAEDLGLPKASASLAVQQLEGALGARLLHRTTRKVELTQDGQSCYERCKDLLAELDELSTLFQGPQALRGRLRVDLPSGMARNHVVPRLNEFLQAHPGIELELSTTDRRVDLVREGFDCVLRVGTLADSSLVARRLGELRMVNCASPDYLARHGTPRTLQDLASHRLVHYAGVFGGPPDGFEHHDGTAWRSLPVAGALTVNSSEAYEAACLAGLGIIQAPAMGMRRLIEQGALVEVLPRHPAAPMPMSFVYAHKRNLSRRVRVFMDWVEEVLRPHFAHQAASG